jgi:hypothetical protein
VSAPTTAGTDYETEGGFVYIGIGTVVLILLVLLIIYFVRRASDVRVVECRRQSIVPGFGKRLAPMYETTFIPERRRAHLAHSPGSANQGDGGFSGVRLRRA